MKHKKYLNIASHYESCLERYGDTHLGVDWPNREEADIRYKVMLEVIRQRSCRTITLLDFGCGASHLYEYMLKNRIEKIEYSGLDISKKFVELSRSKFPLNSYYCMDILEKDADIPDFDYIVMNGVFTEKSNLSFDEMLAHLQAVLCRAFEKARVGIAFNVMSKQVEWEREDLFHLPFDILADFLIKELSRHFVIRNDYGLFEYTTYVYKEVL